MIRSGPMMPSLDFRDLGITSDPNNLFFVWLTSGLKPDHKTITKFRRKNKEALAQVLKQCAKICIKLNLIEGNTWTREKAQKALKHFDE